MAVKKLSKWISVEPGSLRHQITIQRPSTTPDAFGQLNTVWNTIRTCAASVQCTKEDEVYTGGQLVSKVTWLVICRYTATQIKAGYQVLFGNLTLRVQAVENVDQRNMLWNLYCLETDVE